MHGTINRKENWITYGILECGGYPKKLNGLLLLLLCWSFLCKKAPWVSILKQGVYMRGEVEEARYEEDIE